MQEFKYFRFLYFPWKSVFIRGESVFVYGIGKNFATESRGISRNLKANLNVLSVEIRVYPWLNGFLCSSVANRFYSGRKLIMVAHSGYLVSATYFP